MNTELVLIFGWIFDILSSFIVLYFIYVLWPLSIKYKLFSILFIIFKVLGTILLMIHTFVNICPTQQPLTPPSPSTQVQSQSSKKALDINVPFKILASSNNPHNLNSPHKFNRPEIIHGHDIKPFNSF